jgi:hypothetical protein
MLYDQRQLDQHMARVADAQITGATVHLDDNYYLHPIRPNVGDTQDSDDNGGGVIRPITHHKAQRKGPRET